MLIKIILAVICAFIALLIARWLKLDHTLQLVIALLVGVLVFVYGP